MSGAPIRPALPGDLDRLVEVSAAADRLFAAAGLVLPPDDARQALTAAEQVLVIGEPPVGFAALRTVDGLAHLDQLAVRPDHGRRGLGGRLVEAACGLAARQGRPAITLTTFCDLPWNAPWYAARGWRELPPGQWGPQLRALWDAERAAGIAAAPRVAMRRELVRPPGPTS